VRVRHSGHQEKRLQIRFPLSRQAHDLGVHTLLAAQPHLPEQPPHSRNAPQECADTRLNDGYRPVPAAHVKQFMTGNTPLSLGLQRQKRLGEQHHRLSET
jgi:hypothetical protein